MVNVELNSPGDAGPKYVGKPHEDPPVDGVPRDGHGRYALPQLDGTPPPAYKNGNPIGMVRASTIKSALTDKKGVQLWRDALIAQGLSTSPDLIERAAKAAKLVDEKQRKAQLREVSEEAFVRAGGKDRSTLGTAVHDYHEKRGKGLPAGDVPEEHRPSIDAFAQLLIDHHITVLPEYSERVAKLPFGAAGTIDNIVRWLNPETEDLELVVADLKTGRTIELGALEILMQLWQYANAEALAVIRDDQPISYEPVPMDLRKDRALIFHVPMDGTARLYVLDLSGVYDYVWAAVTARRANAEAWFKFREIGQPVDKRGPAFVTPAGTLSSVPVPHPAADVVSVTVTPIQPDPASIVSATMAGFEQFRVGVLPDFPGQVTLQMLADAEKAKERQAVAAGPIAKVEPEINPETGRKRKACSVCRQPGHTAKNCPQNPDSPKYSPEPSNPAEDYVPGESDVTTPTTEPLQYCPTAGAGGWTAVEGRWVCGCHGLPARAAVEAQLNMVSQPTSTAETVAFANGENTAEGVFRTTSPETVVPTWQDDSVTTDIKRAQTADALTGVWQLATAKGLWDPAKHDALASSRAQDLMMEGKMK